MANIPWLEADSPFPPPGQALESPNGLLAAGGDLSPERLLTAYSSGIFPWYEAGQPLLWWSPDPRAVLRPSGLNVSKSLLKRLRRHEFTVYLNRDFAGVISACAGPRAYAGGTWITDEMNVAYCELHQRGYAHSIECYQGETLVGGLYGVGIGPWFFGESMFHHITDASKVAFAHLARFVFEQGCPMIDCQIENDHLMSLGCELMPRQAFLNELNATTSCSEDIQWGQQELNYDWPSREMGLQ
tara:strand:- start:4796 stop:5524 length:729 start_codon:yes stop_codon:yes gene_type:complete